MKNDFNVFDAFKIFDLNGNGVLTVTEFKNALSDLGIFASFEEIELFFKRYDKNRDSRLRFSEFCDALVPNDPYYAAMVNKRSSN
jgi:Ca2+-binding EF-hand superfamily protein